MVTKLICQLPDYDAFGRKGRLSFDPEHVYGHCRIKSLYLTLNHVSDVSSKQSVKATQRSHPVQLKNSSVNEIPNTETRFNLLNIAQFLENNSVLTWVNN